MKIKKMQVGLLFSVIFSLNSFLSAGEILDIKGSFGFGLNSSKFPVGWTPNKPSWWDEAATIALNKIPDTEKYALQITSQTKTIHIYGKRWSIATGDKCVIKAMVKGKGKGGLGVYFYPGGGMKSKDFQATEDWTEFIAEVTIHETKPEIDKICIVLVISPAASIEFADVTAEIVKKQE